MRTTAPTAALPCHSMVVRSWRSPALPRQRIEGRCRYVHARQNCGHANRPIARFCDSCAEDPDDNYDLPFLLFFSFSFLFSFCSRMVAAAFLAPSALGPSSPMLRVSPLAAQQRSVHRRCDYVHCLSLSPRSSNFIVLYTDADRMSPMGRARNEDLLRLHTRDDMSWKARDRSQAGIVFRMVDNGAAGELPEPVLHDRTRSLARWQIFLPVCLFLACVPVAYVRTSSLVVLSTHPTSAGG